MSVAIPPPPQSPSSSSRSLSQGTRTLSGPASPAMSAPSNEVHDSTTLNTSFNTTPSHSDASQLPLEHGKLGLSLSAPHPTLLTPAPPSIPTSFPMSYTTSNGVNTADHASTSATAIPLPPDSALRGGEHGVSPVIHAFRSPYPSSPSYFVTVVPPYDFPLSSELSQSERDRLHRGSLLPLYPTLGGQLWAISREFALPSVGGLMLYLADDGQGNRGPRIGDGAWQALWSRYFAEDEANNHPGFKPTTSFTPSRRSSLAAPGETFDASGSYAPQAADLSRSSLGEGSSSRPSIPYVPSRPSPRVEALSFSRRDASADWSPSARSAAWSGNAASSMGRAPGSAAPFPRLPILARIEWQVDTNKASWWPSWVASRYALREKPSHPARRSMHLANQFTGSKDNDSRDVVERRKLHDGKELEQDQELDNPSTSTQTIETQAPATRSPLMEQEVAHAFVSRPTSSTQAGPFSISAAFVPLPPSTLGDRSERSSMASVDTPSTHERALAVEASAASFGHAGKRTADALVPGRASPSDEPLRSQQASIVSMSSYGSPSSDSASLSSPRTTPRELAAAHATPSIDERAVSPQSRFESSAALLGDHSASDQDRSRTGYSEFLEDDADESQEEDDDKESLSLAHPGEYLAIPDSPESETHELPDQPLSDGKRTSFALRHSFIVDAGDEAIWRDLQQHDADVMFPEPREEHQALPPQNQRKHEEQKEKSERSLNPEPEMESKHENDFDLTQKAIFDDIDYQQHSSERQWSYIFGQTEGDVQPALFKYGTIDAADTRSSPQRATMARIQSWIGKTPTAQPNAMGVFEGFDDDFEHDAREEELDLPKESDIDEVVGLWASKVREDPTAILTISGPTPSVKDVATGKDKTIVEETAERTRDVQDTGSNGLETNLDAAPPAIPLLSPIHLDQAAFGGVKPQLGNLATTLSPQLLSPTMADHAFNTPRQTSDPRTPSTPVLQHTPSSPSSLAPPEDTRAGSSRRSSAELSDTLEEMQMALELLSPGCSPNPAVGQSPDLAGRKMSSRDSLAYARSLSASVTPSPKWIARAKAASVKSRTATRSTFAAGGGSIDRQQMSPRPMSTSAVSSSRRSPRMGLPAPLSASRLAEFSKSETSPRLARTEGGDVDSVRSRDSSSEEAQDAAAALDGLLHLGKGVSPRMTAQWDAEKEARISSLAITEEQRSAEINAEATKGAFDTETELETAKQHAANSETTEEAAESDNKSVELAIKQEVEAEEPTKEPAASSHTPDQALASSVEASEPSVPDAEAIETLAQETQEQASFSGDDEHDIATIQRFLRGKVVSGDSDASATYNMDASISELRQASSADNTIIERSVDSDTHLNGLELPPKRSESVVAAPQVEATESQKREQHHTGRDEIASNERWSQVSYATGTFSPRGASRYSVNLNHAKQAAQHEIDTPSFSYDARLSSEPTTTDTQLSSTDGGADGLSIAGEVVKSYLSSSPSDEAFFISSIRSGAAMSNEAASSDAVLDSGKESIGLVALQQLSSDSEPARAYPEDSGPIFTSPSIPALAYRFASSPVTQENFAQPKRPLAGTHDHTLDEDEIRTMKDDTRAAVREALSQATAHHVNIVPSLPASASAPLSPKSSYSPNSPFSNHSALGDQIRRPGSTSSLNFTSTGTGTPSGTSSPKPCPGRLVLDSDARARSPPTASSARRLPSTSPRGRFGQLPPSPNLHASYKAAASKPLSTSFPIMGAGMGSPEGKGMLPSLASVTSIEGELAK